MRVRLTANQTLLQKFAVISFTVDISNSKYCVAFSFRQNWTPLQIFFSLSEVF